MANLSFQFHYTASLIQKVFLLPLSCYRVPTPLTHVTQQARFEAHPVLLQSRQRFIDAVDKFVDMFKVFGHLSCENHVNDCLSKRPIFIPGERKSGESEYRRADYRRAQEGKMEWVDSVVNSIERRVNSFSIPTAVMNGRFVYCAHLRGPAHVSHCIWGFQSLYSSNVGSTHVLMVHVYLQFTHNWT